VPSPGHSPELDFETHAAFMPPKSRARTGGGEPVEPPRKSSRISRKTEERLSQVTSTAQKGPSSERVQKETGVPSVAKPHQRTTRQRKNDSSAVLGRPTAQAPNTKSTKKAKKAAPIAVSVPGALIRPLKVNDSTS